MLTLRAVFVYIISIFLPQFLSAQITITSQDFLNMIGSRQVVLEEENSSTTVNVGSPGANQVWDFSQMVISDTVVSVSEFLSPGETVSASTFPDANFIQKITIPDAPGSQIFNFFKMTSENFINLGDSTFVSSMGIDTSFVSFQSDTVAPLPVAFNNTWMTFERDTSGFFPTSATISIDTTLNTVDGWGTVRLPLGDFQCLRLRQDVQVINQSIVLGEVVNISTETYIQYNWIGSSSFQLARVQSQDGETDANFTNARGFGVMDTTTASPPTSVEEPPTELAPSEFELLQNYPNPFNPATTISFRTTQAGRIQLTVYNLLGEKVKVLLDENKPAGTYQVRWDGTNSSGKLVSSGTYLYQLKSGDLERTMKLVFLR